MLDDDPQPRTFARAWQLAKKPMHRFRATVTADDLARDTQLVWRMPLASVTEHDKSMISARCCSASVRPRP